MAAGGGHRPGSRPVAAFSLLPFGPAICDAVARSRAPVHWTAQPDPAAPQEQAAAPPCIQAYVCFPLLAGEDVLGALAFASHARERFQEEDVAFLATIAQHVAVVRRRLRADEELRKAERRSRALLEAAPVSIALLEPGSLRVLRANQRACLELGYSMAEFTTLRIADLEMAGTAGHSRPSRPRSSGRRATRSGHASATARATGLTCWCASNRWRSTARTWSMPPGPTSRS
ncbi:GAF domain-containing protein [Teichococcus aestuarii]|uniref:GAF domain-containing protein n=1 Tax=Teichococcus aestuarii TaxID=568898 RepID=UPI0036165C9A